MTALVPQTDPHHASRPRDDGIVLVEAPVPRGLFYGPGVPDRFEARPLATALRAPAALAGIAATAAVALRRCDALVGHWLLPGGLLCAALAGRRPFGVMLHSAGARLALDAPAALRTPARAALRRARFVAAPDPALARALAAVLGREVDALGPRTALAPFLELEPASPRPDAPLRLGFLGRRTPIKGLDRLVTATRQAVEHDRAPLELHVAGPGDRLAERGWLRDHGPLHGADALRGFFAGIDVLVVPSRRLARREEGLPCVVLEAWAAGRPVLASDSGGMAELVPEPWRFPAHLDARALATRLAALAGATGRARVAAAALTTRPEVLRLEAAWRARERVLVERLRPAR